jgi:hypothetical protein
MRFMGSSYFHSNEVVNMLIPGQFNPLSRTGDVETGYSWPRRGTSNILHLQNYRWERRGVGVQYWLPYERKDSTVSKMKFLFGFIERLTCEKQASNPYDSEYGGRPAGDYRIYAGYPLIAIAILLIPLGQWLCLRNNLRSWWWLGFAISCSAIPLALLAASLT